MNNVKYNRNKLLIIVPFLLLIVVFFLTIGYSTFVDTLSITKPVATIRADLKIRVNGVISNSQYATNLNYSEKSIINDVSIPVGESINYTVTVTNLGNVPFAVSGISFISGNGTIENLSSNITQNDYVKICSNNVCTGPVSKDLSLTITNNGSSVIEVTNLNIVLNFVQVYTVTYNDNVIGEVLSGNNFEYKFTTDAPSSLDIAMGGNNLIADTDYTYQNNSLTINNVSGNVSISSDLDTNVILERKYFINAAKNTSIYLMDNEGSTAVSTSLTNKPTWYGGDIDGIRCAATDLTATYSPIWCLDKSGNLYYRYRANVSSNWTAYDLSSYIDFSTYDYFPTVYYRSSTSYVYIIRSDGKMIRVSSNGMPDYDWTYGQTVTTKFVDCASRSGYFACVDANGDVYYQSSYSTSAWSRGYANNFNTVLSLNEKRNFNNTFISVSSEAYETIYVDGDKVYNSHTTFNYSTTISTSDFIESPLPGGGIIDCVTTTDNNDRAYNICLGADKVYYYKLYSATTWTTGGSYDD